jgi:hypothetical protein
MHSFAEIARQAALAPQLSRDLLSALRPAAWEIDHARLLHQLLEDNSAAGFAQAECRKAVMDASAGLGLRDFDRSIKATVEMLSPPASKLLAETMSPVAMAMERLQVPEFQSALQNLLPTTIAATEFQGLASVLATQAAQYDGIFFGLNAQMKAVDAALEQQRTFFQTVQRDILNFPEKALTLSAALRLDLVEDSLRNVAGFQSIFGAGVSRFFEGNMFGGVPEINAAGQFVYHHGTLVRRMHPSIPMEGNDVEEYLQHRDQQLGAKLEAVLGLLDPKLQQLRRRAWENMAKGDAASVRLAAHGIREVFGEVLRRFAPDRDLETAGIWTKRSDSPKPTRKMRTEFILGSDFEHLDEIMQFDASIQRMNKHSHTFSNDIELVRIYMAQLESYTYLLFVYAKPRPN